MVKKIIIVLVLSILIGCGGSPRYTNRRSPEKSEIKKLKPGRSTNENLKLGSILQGFLGMPYKGNSKYVNGLDCSLFTSEVYKKYNGMSFPRTAEDQFRIGAKIKKSDLRYGDLVFFHTDKKRISHVGIYLFGDNFIHASSSKGIIISGLDEKYWSKRFVGARRVLNGKKK